MVKTKAPQEKNIQVVVRCRWVAHKDDGRDKFGYVFLFCQSCDQLSKKRA